MKGKLNIVPKVFTQTTCPRCNFAFSLKYNPQILSECSQMPTSPHDDALSGNAAWTPSCTKLATAGYTHYTFSHGKFQRMDTNAGNNLQTRDRTCTPPSNSLPSVLQQCVVNVAPETIPTQVEQLDKELYPQPVLQKYTYSPMFEPVSPLSPKSTTPAVHTPVKVWNIVPESTNTQSSYLSGSEYHPHGNVVGKATAGGAVYSEFDRYKENQPPCSKQTRGFTTRQACDPTTQNDPSPNEDQSRDRDSLKALETYLRIINQEIKEEPCASDDPEESATQSLPRTANHTQHPKECEERGYVLTPDKPFKDPLSHTFGNCSGGSPLLHQFPRTPQLMPPPELPLAPERKMQKKGLKGPNPFVDVLPKTSLCTLDLSKLPRGSKQKENKSLASVRTSTPTVVPTRFKGSFKCRDYFRDLTPSQHSTPKSSGRKSPTYSRLLLTAARIKALAQVHLFFMHP